MNVIKLTKRLAGGWSSWADAERLSLCDDDLVVGLQKFNRLLLFMMTIWCSLSG